jgi:hypothetical protein
MALHRLRDESGNPRPSTRPLAGGTEFHLYADGDRPISARRQRDGARHLMTDWRFPVTPLMLALSPAQVHAPRTMGALFVST